MILYQTFWLPPGLPVQLETLKTDLATRDNEIVGLKMKVDTLTNQQSEHQHYIDVLKDQIRSKEQQSSMFNADVGWCLYVYEFVQWWNWNTTFDMLWAVQMISCLF